MVVGVGAALKPLVRGEQQLVFLALPGAQMHDVNRDFKKSFGGGGVRLLRELTWPRRSFSLPSRSQRGTKHSKMVRWNFSPPPPPHRLTLPPP